MATLYQRNGRFYVNYTVNGRRVRKSLGTDRAEAQLRLNELRFKLSNGAISTSRPEIPLDYFFKHYLENCMARLSKGTTYRYRNAIKHLQEFFTRHRPIQFISQINKGIFQDYIIYRQSMDRKPKNKTINMELTIIRAALSWAVDNEWIEKNPASRIKLLKMNDAKKGRALTDDEVMALIRGCETLRDGEWFKDILVVFLNTGMRRGELTNLTWEDIDWDQEVIKIQEKDFWSPKTYERIIPISSKTANILKRLKEQAKGSFVFTTRRGGKIRDKVLREKLITLAKRVGLLHITRIHDLRHTFASNLLMSGVDIPTVQTLLGHRSWNTTLIYSHQTKDHIKRAVEVLN